MKVLNVSFADKGVESNRVAGLLINTIIVLFIGVFLTLQMGLINRGQIIFQTI